MLRPKEGRDNRQAIRQVASVVILARVSGRHCEVIINPRSVAVRSALETTQVQGSRSPIRE